MQQDNQNKGPFPRDKEEALKFSNDILQVMYDDQYHANLVKQLQNVDEQNKPHALGLMASNIIGDRVADVRAQTGKQVEMKLVIDGLKTVISELTGIAEDNKLFKTSPEEENAALRSSVETLDQIGAQNGQ